MHLILWLHDVEKRGARSLYAIAMKTVMAVCKEHAQWEIDGKFVRRKARFMKTEKFNKDLIYLPSTNIFFFYSTLFNSDPTSY